MKASSGKKKDFDLGHEKLKLLKWNEGMRKLVETLCYQLQDDVQVPRFVGASLGSL